MSRQRVAAVVMAAGKGTRLRSDTAKVLHEVAGRSLLHHVLAALASLELDQVVVVVGHQAEEVSAHAADLGIANLTAVVQHPLNGTAHAVEVAMTVVSADIDKVVVLNGDSPLLTSDVLAALMDTPVGAAAMVTTTLEDPTGYGRVLRDEDDRVSGIVEDRDANDDQRAVNEINGGMYAFDRHDLDGRLEAVDSSNDQGERYVTDLITHLVADGVEVVAVQCAPEEIAGVNDRGQLAAAGVVLRRRHLDRLMVAGVTVIDPNATWIDVTVDIEPEAVILPGCLLTGATHIGARAVIGPHTELHDSEVGVGARVRQSVCDTVAIGPDADVGPFTHLRPGTELAQRVKTGAFVQVKGSSIGADSKVPHLAYVGDATVGKGVNIACGVITVNYDGRDKHPTVIGDGAFVGCDSMLIAPIEIGAGAFVAAGSTLTDDVPADALAIARVPQHIKDGWAARRRESEG